MSAAFTDFSRLLSAEATRQALKAKREGGVDGLVTLAVAEALMRVSAAALETAKAEKLT